MTLQDLQDETTIRAALHREFTESFPDGDCGALRPDGSTFTAAEWVEDNLRDVLERVAAL